MSLPKTLRQLGSALLAAAIVPTLIAGEAIAQDASAPAVPEVAPQVAEDVDVGRLSASALLDRNAVAREAALQALVARGELDVAPTLVFFMRVSREPQRIAAALSDLTGEPIADWHDAVTWLEGRPDITPHESFAPLKLSFWRSIDPTFLQFFEGDRLDPAKMRIRFEEIVWGGVQVDGIPSLDNPPLISADDAGYLRDDDLVFGVEINGDVRAYPLRIMGWHEMFNETIGGVPVALAYCTLCGAGILYETAVEGYDEPFVFGSSGFLYRSNKLMFDRQTNSLWNQFTGEPVVGPLVGTGVVLKIRPVVITSWADWRAQNPDTKVLSIETGHLRDYGSGVVYREYFDSPDLMFPALVRDESIVQRKDFVYGVRALGASKAWPIAAFEAEPVINDTVGALEIVLIGDPETRTVRAYERAGRRFGAGDDAATLSTSGGVWTITEATLNGPAGERLPRVPGHITYWFAWENYLGDQTELYTP